MKLKELSIGDRFFPASKAKKTPIYKVIGKPEFNRGHGTSTRICYNEVTRESVSKSCNLDVVVLIPNHKHDLTTSKQGSHDLPGTET